jgi:starvation-inducible outer membrane lipoprotein
MSFLIIWFTAVLAGCGATPEQVKEERKEKQQVVQEKMKEYMQQKAKAKGLRR